MSTRVDHLSVAAVSRARDGTRQMMETLQNASRLRLIFIAVALLLAGLHTWADRYTMNPDGISYLDIADAFVRYDWTMAINRLWSPLYPLALGLGMAIFRPSPQWEFPFVHYVNFVIFLAALASFDFFLRQLLAFREAQADAQTKQSRIRISPTGIVAVGYVIFIWSSLNLATMAAVGPDQMMAIFAYLAAGWFLRTRMQPRGWASFGLLGCALGLGYLAKAPMFPVAVVFFAIAIFWIPMNRAIPKPGLALRVTAAIAVFSLVVTPLVLAFFRINGRITIGDSARLNYVWLIDRVPLFHWQGRPGYQNAPRHPTRMISKVPAAYEFATPVGGTYPPWFDPAYWYEGVAPWFDARGHVWAILRSLRVASPRAAIYHWVPSVGLLVVLAVVMRRTRWSDLRGLTAYSGIWIPAVVAFGMLSPVHLEPRYVHAFVVLLWLGLVPGLAFPASPEGGATAKRLVAAILIVHIAFIAAVTGMALGHARKNVFEGLSASSSADWQVAEGLMKMGLQPGDRVAILGRGAFAYWARLARVRIVGEIPVASESDFWAADADIRQRVLRRFAAVGAMVVVLPPPETRRRDVRSNVDLSVMGWRRVGHTEYYAMPLVE